MMKNEENGEVKTLARLTASQNVDSIALLGNVITHDNDNEQGNGQVHNDDEDIEIKSQAIVLGTYALEEQQRHGSLDIIRVKHIRSSCRYHDHDSFTSSFSLETESTTPTNAILDVTTTTKTGTKFDQDNSSSVNVYAACAEDTILETHTKNPFQSLQHCIPIPTTTTTTTTTTNNEKDTLNLSIHLSSDLSNICSSNSNGVISIFQKHQHSWTLSYSHISHMSEAWCCTFTSSSSIHPMTNVISGGDDGILCMHDIRQGIPCWRIRDAHNGVGITSVAISNENEQQLWSGGYDDCVYIWDIRKMDNRKNVLAHVNVDGGAWRIKFHPYHQNIALIPVMYAGCKVVKWEKDKTQLSVVAEYSSSGDGNDRKEEKQKKNKEHESIVYGAEWITGLENENDSQCNNNNNNNNKSHRKIAITGSFYDKAVRLWCLENEL